MMALPITISLLGVIILLASISNQLKRIADAMDSASPKGSVLWWLEQIASAANAGRDQ